jgi:hypothetical protein
MTKDTKSNKPSWKMDKISPKADIPATFLNEMGAHKKTDPAKERQNQKPWKNPSTDKGQGLSSKLDHEGKEAIKKIREDVAPNINHTQTGKNNSIPMVKNTSKKGFER